MKQRRMSMAGPAMAGVEAIVPDYRNGMPGMVTGCKLGDPVSVDLYQWIPPGDGQGAWKYTGRGFLGRLVGGPMASADPESGTLADGVRYVLPDQAVHGTVAPIEISGEPFDPYGGTSIATGETDPRAGQEMLLFTVIALGRALDA